MIWRLHHIIPEVSKNTIHEAVTEKLGYRELCARWVPKILTITKRNGCVPHWNFSRAMHKKEKSFWTPLWLEMRHGFFTALLNPSNSHCNMHSPRTKKLKTSISMKKIMASVFWDRKGILMVYFMPSGTTINAAAYCDTLTQLRRTIQNKKRGML